ncbi:hypothetical protein JM654_03855 [Microbacterium oxydans]|nr:hypothetical protein [Microbacterium oxydans]
MAEPGHHAGARGVLEDRRDRRARCPSAHRRFRLGAGAPGPAAASAFTSVVGAAGRAASAAGQALGHGIQSAATGTVTVAAAGIAVAFTKGFGRLAAIDTARAKLTGLAETTPTR